MEFRLKSRNYIFDRLLEPGTVVSPKGFREPLGEVLGPLNEWGLVPGQGLVWSAVPNMEMEPIDAEAQAAFRKRYPHGAFSPIEQLPLTGELQLPLKGVI